MKRSLFHMLFLLLCNGVTVACDQNNQKRSAIYNSYFIIKEYSNFFITYRYYLDQEKVEKAKIVCNQCDYIVGYRHLCCHYIFNVEDTKLKNTINQMRNASSDELPSLLLNSYEEISKPCDQCKEYHGWHIETSDQNIQNEKEIAQVERAKQKLYAYYLLIKELCTMPFYNYFLDKEKIEQAKISCLQCHDKTNAFHLHGWLIGECDELTLQNLKNIMYYESAENLSIFILKISQEHQIECPICGQYNGYYISVQEPASQS